MFRTLFKKLPFKRIPLGSVPTPLLKPLILVLTLASEPLQAAASPQTVAILQIIEHPALNATRQGIIETLQKKNPSLKVIWKSAQGSPALATQICQQFVGESASVIVALGTTAAQTAVTISETSKIQGKSIPVVFASVTDPQSAKIADKSCGVSNYIDVKDQLDAILKIVPSIKSLGVIYNPGEAFTEKIIQLTQTYCQQKGIKLVESPAYKTSEVGTATSTIIDKVDAIFINNDNTALAAFPVIVKICDTKKVPVFTSDVDVIGQGALAVLGPDQYKIGEQTANGIEQLLKGVPITKVGISYPQDVEQHINLTKAQELGIKIAQEVLDQPDIKIYTK